MNDIDLYLDQACRRVSGPATLRKHLRKELKEHLEESIDALVAEGMSKQEATTAAIESLGEPEAIRDGMQSVYGQSVTALLVDHAMQWKERTMKSDWKWKFAAQVGVVLNIWFSLGVTCFLFIFITPKLMKILEDMGVGDDLPGYSQLMLSTSVAEFVDDSFFYLILPLVVAAIGLFEWKCKSEDKSLIRTTMLVGVSLVAAAFAFWTLLVHIVCFVFVSVGLLAQQLAEVR